MSLIDSQWLNWAYECGFLLAGWGCTRVWARAIYSLVGRRLQRKNYRGVWIPTAMGLAISLSLATVICLQPERSKSPLDPVLLAGIWMATSIGILDDLSNEKDVKGVSAHFRQAWRQKQLTAGSLKAVTLLIGSFWIARQLEPGTYNWLVGGLVIALSSNSLNLFDLRPGRAIKVAGLILGILILLYIPTSHVEIQRVSPGILEQGHVESGFAILKWSLLLLGSLIGYAPMDFKGICMLGDTGANMIGLVLGGLLLKTVGEPNQWFLLAGLIALHVFAERYSITKLIESFPILRLLDRLGIQDRLYTEEDFG
jgi:UDP-GlcNAc:undecaprenyl-phosphate/decaprenyl-phosphate GlcNAc-1-phosphate transferase